jgi:hypothetical protein
MGELIKVGNQSLSILNKHIKIANKAFATVETDRLVQLFSRHPEEIIKQLSSYAKLDLDLLEDYKLSWSWYSLSGNSGLPWTKVLIEKYEDRWNWRGHGLSSNLGLPWSEALIERYEDRWDWYDMSRDSPWTEALIERYEDRWNWDWDRYIGLSGNTGLPWTEALIERYEDRWNWDGLSWNSGLPWTEALIERYEDRWD